MQLPWVLTYIYCYMFIAVLYRFTDKFIDSSEIEFQEFCY